MKYKSIIITELGIFEIELEDDEVISLNFNENKLNEKRYSVNKDCVGQQLKEYFEGKRKVFDLKFKLEGTDFQKRVWMEIAKIPYGEMISYTELAKRVGNPKAIRAVGTACGANPIPVIIPCHRVRGKLGLGGYSGGLWLKKKLLELEGVGIIY